MQSILKDRSTIIENLNNSEAEKILSNTEVIQRLHPDWRMIPHLSMFGWTEQHQQLEDYLNNKVKSGKIATAYFSSHHDYIETEWRLNNSRVKFLSGPVVNTIEGIIEVIEKSKDKMNLLPFTVDQVLGRNPESVFSRKLSL